ncbi:hypothetical protein B0H16DRAFT_1420684, partial [Mycena metata]
MVLYPQRHPDDNLADLANLKASPSASLYYEGVSAFALLHFPQFKYPAVALERSHFVSATTCSASGNTMTVTFNNPEAWKTAAQDWTQHPEGFVVISYIAGCGHGLSTAERTFHLVTSVRLNEGKLQIICSVSMIPMTDAHPGHEIKFHMTKYTGTPSSPPKHSRRQDDGPTGISDEDNKAFGEGLAKTGKVIGQSIATGATAIAKGLWKAFTPSPSAAAALASGELPVGAGLNPTDVVNKSLQDIATSIIPVPVPVKSGQFLFDTSGDFVDIPDVGR